VNKITDTSTNATTPTIIEMDIINARHRKRRSVQGLRAMYAAAVDEGGREEDGKRVEDSKAGGKKEKEP